MNQTFPKTVRLNQSQIIREVFTDGVYKSLGVIGVKYKKATVESSRFSISIKKRVGIAPFRNKIKRFIREAVRLEISDLNCSFDMCFFVTNRSNFNTEFKLVKDEIKQFFDYLNKEFSN